MALVWTIPAAVALPRPAGVAAYDGTLWRGGATLIDGSRLAWRWAPLRSLWTLGLAIDWEVRGRGTALAGHAVLRGNVTLESAHGTAAGALLAGAAPELPFACDVPLRVALAGSAFGGGGPAGTIRSGPGLCAPRAGGGASRVPALVATVTRRGAAGDIGVAPAGQPQRTLARGTIDARGLALEPTPAGLATLAFLVPPGGP